MPAILTELPSPPQPRRKRWTRAECATLQTLGLLDNQHLELVEGELFSKMGKKRPHTNALTSVYLWLMDAFGRYRVTPHIPIDVAPDDNPTNEPEPDIIVLKKDFWTFQSANPGPADLHLVVEIADTALAFDLTTKSPLYSRAGILEYWVLDVTGRRLFVHRKPEAGIYTEVVVYSEQERVAPLAAPHAEFEVASAFREQDPAMM